jgi:hypothetical protein
MPGVLTKSSGQQPLTPTPVAEPAPLEASGLALTMIQALIPLGLRAVEESWQQEVLALVGPVMCMPMVAPPSRGGARKRGRCFLRIRSCRFMCPPRAEPGHEHRGPLGYLRPVADATREGRRPIPARARRAVLSRLRCGGGSGAGGVWPDEVECVAALRAPARRPYRPSMSGTSLIDWCCCSTASRSPTTRSSSRPASPRRVRSASRASCRPPPRTSGRALPARVGRARLRGALRTARDPGRGQGADRCGAQGFRRARLELAPPVVPARERGKLSAQGPARALAPKVAGGARPDNLHLSGARPAVTRHATRAARRFRRPESCSRPRRDAHAASSRSLHKTWHHLHDHEPYRACHGMLLSDDASHHALADQ